VVRLARAQRCTRFFMSSRTILVSSNHNVISQLAQACEAAGQGRGSLVFVESKEVSAVRELLDASGETAGAVIADLSGNEGGIEVLKTLSDAYPDLVLAAAHPAPSAEIILSAMRAGASEFLTPPFDLSRLVREVQQPKLVGAPTPPIGKVIAFLPAQSGNGASTAALHAACAASRELHGKVLLVELDFHCSVLRQRLKLEADRSIAEILERTDNLDELWPWIVQPWNGIDLLPSPASSRKLACKSLQKLPKVLEFAASRYGTVVLDLPSALMSSTRDILALTDELYLICTPEVTSLHLARRRTSELMEMGMTRDALRVVVNRAGSGQPLPTHDLAQVIGLPVYCSLDNDYLALNEAWEEARLLSKQVRLGRQLYEMGAAMVGAQQPAPKPPRQSWKALLSVFQHHN
jgi:pilus assembly protein CpaE